MSRQIEIAFGVWMCGALVAAAAGPPKTVTMTGEVAGDVKNVARTILATTLKPAAK